MSVPGRRNYMYKGPGAGGAYQVGDLKKGHCGQNREVKGEHGIRWSEEMSDYSLDTKKVQHLFNHSLQGIMYPIMFLQHVEHWEHSGMVPTQSLLTAEWTEALELYFIVTQDGKDVIRGIRAKSYKNSENWEIVGKFLAFLLGTNGGRLFFARSIVWFWWRQGGKVP